MSLEIELEKVIDKLLKIHYDQLAECRQRNYILTERTIGALLIIIGFVVFGQIVPSPIVASLAVLGILGGSFAVCVILYTNNRAYLLNARAIRNINRMLHLCDTQPDLGEPIYPDEWKSFGQKTPTQLSAPLWLFIGLVAVLASVGAWVRPVLDPKTGPGAKGNESVARASDPEYKDRLLLRFSIETSERTGFSR